MLIVDNAAFAARLISSSVACPAVLAELFGYTIYACISKITRQSIQRRGRVATKAKGKANGAQYRLARRGDQTHGLRSDAPDMKWLLSFVVAIGLLVGLYHLKYPNYTYRYRLTVNIEIEGKIHSGSSVIEVTWHGGPEIGDVGPYAPTLKGQAALVDLGNRGVVTATLITGEGYGRAQDGAWGALWIVPRAFGRDSSNRDLPLLPKLVGKRDLASDNLPRFLWFSNPGDPTTAHKLSMDNLSATLGQSARFAGASVEIAFDPIVIDIRSKLPWIKSMEEKPLGTPPLYLPNKLAITRHLFIGDAS